MIDDDEGNERVGGAYTWRSVTAADPETAAQAAVRLLLEAPVFRKEIRNPAEFPPQVVAEEIYVLQEGKQGRNTAVVFFIDTNEEQ